VRGSLEPARNPAMRQGCKRAPHLAPTLNRRHTAASEPRSGRPVRGPGRDCTPRGLPKGPPRGSP
jgi:hypothetical protein